MFYILVVFLINVYIHSVQDDMDPVFIVWSPVSFHQALNMTEFRFLHVIPGDHPPTVFQELDCKGLLSFFTSSHFSTCLTSSLISCNFTSVFSTSLYSFPPLYLPSILSFLCFSLLFNYYCHWLLNVMFCSVQCPSQWLDTEHLCHVFQNTDGEESLYSNAPVWLLCHQHENIFPCMPSLHHNTTSVRIV